MMWLVAWLAVTGEAGATAWVGSDLGGADLVLADGDTVEGSFVNVGLLHVPAGARVGVVDGSTLAVDAAEIVIDGLLDGRGAGLAGAQIFNVDGEGDGGGATQDLLGGGGGGAGHGGPGGRGGGGDCYYFVAGELGGARYGLHDQPLDVRLGSGGGGGYPTAANGGLGGHGGGAILLSATRIVVSAGAVVRVDGDVGGTTVSGCAGCDTAGGGGGSGGTLSLVADEIVVDGVLSARGGAGGESFDAGFCTAGGGGGGAGGRIKVRGAVVALASADVAGGDGGIPASPNGIFGRLGGDGTVWVEDWLATGAPTLTVSGTCPGLTDIVTAGASGLGDLIYVVGSGPGADPLPAGVCGGMASGIAGITKLARVQATSQGAHVAQPNLSAALCGQSIQVIDPWTCTASPVVTLP